MVRCRILFFMMLLCLATVHAQECGMVLTADTILSKDLLCEGDALVLEQSHMTLDCQGKSIFGKGLGNGVTASTTGVTIKNCIIDGFENGVLIDRVEKVKVLDSRLSNNLMGAHIFFSNNITVKGNDITNNTFYGLYMKDSLVEYEENTFAQNRQDSYELTTERSSSRGTRVPREQRQEEQPATDPPQEEPLMDLKEGIDVITKEAISPGPITLQVPVELAKELLEKAGVSKEVKIEEGKTEYDITVIPKQDLKGVQVVEEIPLEVASKSREIDANLPFHVVDEGNAQHGPTIRFNLGDLKKDEAKTVTYSINKEVLTEFALRPTTILTMEEAINPGALWTLRVLFSSALILLACYLYLSKSLHRRHHYLIHLGVFSTGVLIFVLFNVKIEVVVSEEINNMIMGIVLGLAVIFLLGADLRYLIRRYRHPEEKQEIEDLEF